MRGTTRFLALVTAVCTGVASAAVPAPSGRPKLVVLELTPAGGISPELASALTDALTTEAAARSPFDVVSSRDVQTLLGLERQRQMLGCGEESESCLAELAGALGARFVMSGSLAQLGDAVQLTLQTLDTRTARPVGRATRIAPNLASLQAQLPWVLAEATATPPPEPPSRVLPVTLVAVGGAALVGAGVLGVSATARDAQVRRELELAQAGSLNVRRYYEDEARTVRTHKTLALVGGGLGAALAAGGTWLLLRPAGRAAPVRKAAKVTLVPAAGGVGLVGVWP